MTRLAAAVRWVNRFAPRAGGVCYHSSMRQLRRVLAPVVLLTACSSTESEVAPGPGLEDASAEASTDSAATTDVSINGSSDTSFPDGGAAETSTADATTIDSTGVDTFAPETSAADANTPDMNTSDATANIPDAPVVTPGSPGTVDVTLSLRADLNAKAISPLIYGINGDYEVAKNRPTLVRQGGNRLTAYNWEMNGSNAGKDYCYQNDGTFLPSGTNVPGYAFKPMLDDAKTRGHAVMVTVPIVDYVAADTNDNGDNGAGPPTCVGDVRKTGSTYLQTRFRQNKPTKGAAFSLSPDTTDGFVYQDEFANWALSGYGTQNVLFSLDNEPDLWSDTHAEVHSAKVGYDELVKRNVDFAKAIKAAWPAAQTLGFVSYGYAGYTTLQDAPDRAGKGDFTDYYLGKMKDAETANGKRLVDYLDLHYYSEARGDGARVSDNYNTTSASARVQAPRSLWDPTYSEDSWIVNDVLHEPIRLIPRYQQKIATRYPGTKLAVTEWNFGGGNHVSGAIATADSLGIFGREGVAAANLWFLHQGQVNNEEFTRAGLRMFTSFDNAGARFGDTSVSATTSDVAICTVYASYDAANVDRVVVVITNKSSSPRTAGLTVAHWRNFTKAKVYRLAGSTPTIAAQTDITATATNAFRVTMPAMSVTTLALLP